MSCSANRPNAPDDLPARRSACSPANDTGWLINTNARELHARQGVNLVMPFGGAGSFYTDWQQRDLSSASTAGRPS